MRVPSRTIDVQLGSRSYPIHIAPGSLRQVGPRVVARRPVSHAVVTVDQNVSRYGRQVVGSLEQCGVQVDWLDVPAGEASKSVERAAELWAGLLACHTDRQSVVVAVGGGVIGDLAGFVAATYARGLDVVQVPTTLLAQVDSSVGGKVGINLPAAKNMVGAFWQPRYVAIDPQVLETLPAREYQSGLAEVVKYGVILDADFFSYLEQNVQPLRDRDAQVLTEVIGRCCRLKADVVERDERETTGLRAVLNYGHTFAHALEAVAGYGRLLHGEAVAIGMSCAARLAFRLGRLDQATVDRQYQLLCSLGLSCHLPRIDPAQLVAAMRHDKKVEHGKLRFILPTRLGRVELVPDVDPQLVERVLDEHEGG